MQSGHALTTMSLVPVVLASFLKQSVSIQPVDWELSPLQAIFQTNLRNRFGSFLAAVGQKGTRNSLTR